MIIQGGLYREYEYGRVFRVKSVACLWAEKMPSHDYVIFHPEEDESVLYVLPEKDFNSTVVHLGTTSSRFAYLEPVRKTIHGKIEG